MFHVKHHQITHQPLPKAAFRSVDELMGRHRKNLQSYLEQLFWWNERMNLVSRNVSRETVWEHIRHSLLVSQLDCYKKSRQVIDSGTGGGLPGLPLSIVSEEKGFLLNDIVTKKILAVKQMARQLSLGHVLTSDESIAELDPDHSFVLLSKHAFKISELYRMTSEMPWNAMIFYKGMDFKDEIKEIETPLSITAYDLFEHSADDFYKEKALVVVKSRQ